MFRYIAIAWDETQTVAAAAARRLGQDWQGRAGWDAALLRPGLQVFTTGATQGVNEVTRLQGAEGVVLGRLFRRHEPHPPIASGMTLDSEEAASILQSGGRTLVNYFWGRYVAFLPAASGSSCVLRDPSGALPCFRLRHNGVSVIFSWLEDALGMLAGAAPPRVNWDALTAQLLRGTVTGRETSLDGVLHVLPGEVFDLHLDEPTLLWNAVDIARFPSESHASDAAQLLRSTVRTCASAWASCYETLLLRLSGGVDSSILLSCLDPGSTQATVICLNYHSPGADSDERLYARQSAARAGRDLLERGRDPGYRIEQVLQIARMADPVPYIGWMNSGTDARLASAFAAPAMFTGAGGDALFFEIPMWWPAADYLQVRGLDAGFAAAALDAARLGKVSLWQAIAQAAQERVRPKLAARVPRGYAGLLSEGIQHEALDWQRFIHPAFGEANDLPIGKYTQTVALMHPIGYYDPFAQDSAPELVNPLLSQPLIELCLRLPTYVLTQGGQGRALARQAFAPDLPQKIIQRRTKGGMESHIKTVLKANIDLVRSLLLDGELCRRGMLDRAKVEALLSGRPNALPGSISQIHAVAAIEAWLSRWPR